MKKLLSTLLVLLFFATPALAGEGLTDFSTYDMTLQPATQDIFSAYDLTMVNIWATWCGYCVQELPELAKLKDMLPENVNLITICMDASTETILAYQLLEYHGANFQTLIATQEMHDHFLHRVSVYPCTYFMDSSGMPVGEPILGLPSLDDTAGTYYAIIQELLAR